MDLLLRIKLPAAASQGGEPGRPPSANNEKMVSVPGYLALESLESTSSQLTTFHHADM